MTTKKVVDSTVRRVRNEGHAMLCVDRFPLPSIRIQVRDVAGEWKNGCMITDPYFAIMPRDGVPMVCEHGYVALARMLTAMLDAELAS